MKVRFVQRPSQVQVEGGREHRITNAFLEGEAVPAVEKAFTDQEKAGSRESDLSEGD